MQNARLIALLQQEVADLEAALPPEGQHAAVLAHNKKLRRARLRLARARCPHSAAEWRALVAEVGGVCVRCGHVHDLSREMPVKGRIIPIALGGTDALSNLMPLCRRCASAKGAERIDWLALWRADHESVSDVKESESA